MPGGKVARAPVSVPPFPPRTSPVRATSSTSRRATSAVENAFDQLERHSRGLTQGKAPIKLPIRNIIAERGVLERGVHFLMKPFSIDDLLQKVRQVLDADHGGSGSP